MLEESQIVFHMDLEDEEIILPSVQSGLRNGHRDWNGKNQQEDGHSGSGDGMLPRLGPASTPCG